MAKTDNQPTAVSSQASPQSGAQNTSKTSSLTREQALEILQEAVRRCQQAGITASFGPFYDAGTVSLVILISDVGLVNGSFVLAKKGGE